MSRLVLVPSLQRSLGVPTRSSTVLLRWWPMVLGKCGRGAEGEDHILLSGVL